jgi:hypothetical protein
VGADTGIYNTIPGVDVDNDNDKLPGVGVNNDNNDNDALTGVEMDMDSVAQGNVLETSNGLGKHDPIEQVVVPTTGSNAIWKEIDSHALVWVVMKHMQASTEVVDNRSKKYKYVPTKDGLGPREAMLIPIDQMVRMEVIPLLLNKMLHSRDWGLIKLVVKDRRLDT